MVDPNDPRVQLARSLGLCGHLHTKEGQEMMCVQKTPCPQHYPAAMFGMAGQSHAALGRLQELLHSVARATAELCAEEYESGAELWAEREQVAQEIVSATISEASEDPDAPLNAVVGALVGGGA